MSQWGRQAHSPLNYQVNLIGQLHYTGFSNLVYGIRNLSSNPCFTDKVHFTLPWQKCWIIVFLVPSELLKCKYLSICQSICLSNGRHFAILSVFLSNLVKSAGYGKYSDQIYSVDKK